ncbi:Uncharacterised protein [Serratia marcescens]|nr:Uncharacterised protein [Serratia marcescens]
MNTASCLPIEVRTAVFRRAVAQAYLDTCAFYRVSLGYTLDELQMTIALRLEGHFVRQYGAEDGMDMACTMLSDMVQPDVLVAAPRLTALGQKMMDELQMTIALRLEGHFVRQYGAEDGMDMACTMLSDMVQPDVLVAAPRLTALGQKMMDELCCERLSAAQNATVH